MSIDLVNMSVYMRDIFYPYLLTQDSSDLLIGCNKDSISF